MSRSDPYAVAHIEKADQKGKVTYTELGRTETIGNTSNPEFAHQFIVDFFFNEVQHIKVEIFDHDTVTADDSLGVAVFTLGSLMASPGRSLITRLNKSSGAKAKGSMTIRAEEVASVADWCRLTMRGIKLPNKDGLFGKSDPYFTIARVREDNEWQQVHKSEVIMNDLNPLWKPQYFSVQAICNGDYLRPLRVEVYDWDQDGSHDIIGIHTTNLRGLLKGQGHELALENPKKPRKSKGHLRVEHAEIEKRATLLEFLAGGLQINMMVAIDFTGSNGDPSHPQSLHYITPGGRLNEYQQAILSIGTILQDYDHDKMFPVYGFGGRVGTREVSHCFPICRVSNAGASDEALGVQGILSAYSAALHNVTLAGPTLFSEVLQTAMARASSAESSQVFQRYDVALILTDGIINDMRETIDLLVGASNLPLSIVIVGVGGADFSDMNALDGDGQRLKDSAGFTATRDIVQFVPFSKYPPEDRHGSRLAADTTAEIPGQLLAYFASKGIVPNPPRPPVPYAPVSPVGAYVQPIASSGGYAVDSVGLHGQPNSTAGGHGASSVGAYGHAYPSGGSGGVSPIGVYGQPNPYGGGHGGSSAGTYGHPHTPGRGHGSSSAGAYGHPHVSGGRHGDSPAGGYGQPTAFGEGQGDRFDSPPPYQP